MPLTVEQERLVDDWFPDRELVADLSWGLVDTLVLHLRTGAGEVVVKAAGPHNHHIVREAEAHQHWTGSWLAEGRVGRLLRHDPGANLLALEYLPGVLVQGSPRAGDAELHRQAGALLAAFHRQGSRADSGYHHDQGLRALAWLDRPHRIRPDAVAALRALVAPEEPPPALLVPTHGDWQERNWLVDGEVLRVIDLGRFAWRPACTDIVRLHRREWARDEHLAEAFVEGYGSDLRQAPDFRLELVREAVATAGWAHRVGDEPFELEGLRGIAEALDRPLEQVIA